MASDRNLTCLQIDTPVARSRSSPLAWYLLSHLALVSAASQVVRRELYEAYRWFAAAFRSASEKLRAGNRMVSFPDRQFPTGLAVRSRIAGGVWPRNALFRRALAEVYPLDEFLSQKQSGNSDEATVIPCWQASRASGWRLGEQFRPSFAPGEKEAP